MLLISFFGSAYWRRHFIPMEKPMKCVTMLSFGLSALLVLPTFAADKAADDDLKNLKEPGWS
jgi:hypothetical protein